MQITEVSWAQLRKACARAQPITIIYLVIYFENPELTWGQVYSIWLTHPDLTWPAGQGGIPQVRFQGILDNSDYT